MKMGLVLTGGGARAAYQVGVLKALAEVVPRGSANPFPVVCGTSAGAINAASLACFGNDFHRAVDELERVWSGFAINKVVRSDPWTMARSSLHWFTALVSGGTLATPPRSLLDNEPLRALLREEVPLERIPEVIAKGELDAVAVTASGYNSASSVTFYEGADDREDWSRSRREGRRTRLTVEHLMASVSLPLLFPATVIGPQWYGDGALRQSAPLSPALHLGADRILVIALRHEAPESVPSEDQPAAVYPSMGQIAGYMLDALFTDSLYNDAERLRRINRTVAVADNEAVPLRQVDLMIVSPSEDPRAIAARHLRALPRGLRALLWGVGALNRGGMQLVSYLLFESGSRVSCWSWATATRNRSCRNCRHS
jgi:NTE family protein